MHGAFNVKIQLSVYITIEQSLLVKKKTKFKITCDPRAYVKLLLIVGRTRHIYAMTARNPNGRTTYAQMNGMNTLSAADFDHCGY